MATVKIMAMLRARPGRTDDLAALLDGMLGPSRAEQGNLRYDLWRDRDDADVFALDELYVDFDAVTAHRATPHFQRYLAAINELAERSAVVLDPVAIA